MNIAITGITGYFGQKLLYRLQKEINLFDKLLGVDLKEPQLQFKKFKFCKCDIRDPKIFQILKNNNIDTLIHLAFLVKPIHDINKAYDINVNGTKNVLKACEKASIKKIIVTSSGAVYGAHPDNQEFLNENSILRPNQDYYYCIHKFELEELCKKYKEKNPETIFTIFRPCNLYGKNVNDLLSKSYEKKKLYLFKGFDPERQLIHEDDAVEGFILALQKNADGIYNLSPDEPFLTTKKIANLLNKEIKLLSSSNFLYNIFKLMWETHLIEAPPGFVHFKKYRWILSNEKIKKDLGFKPKYSTEEALMSKYA